MNPPQLTAIDTMTWHLVWQNKWPTQRRRGESRNAEVQISQQCLLADAFPYTENISEAGQDKAQML